jgi:hypothetical protein
LDDSVVDLGLLGQLLQVLDRRDQPLHRQESRQVLRGVFQQNFSAYRKVGANGKSGCLATVRFGFVRAYAPNLGIGAKFAPMEVLKKLPSGQYGFYGPAVKFNLKFAFYYIRTMDKILSTIK